MHLNPAQVRSSRNLQKLWSVPLPKLDQKMEEIQTVQPPIVGFPSFVSGLEVKLCFDIASSTATGGFFNGDAYLWNHFVDQKKGKQNINEMLKAAEAEKALPALTKKP